MVCARGMITAFDKVTFFDWKLFFLELHMCFKYFHYHFRDLHLLFLEKNINFMPLGKDLFITATQYILLTLCKDRFVLHFFL